jgi:hypothetical protein
MKWNTLKVKYQTEDKVKELDQLDKDKIKNIKKIQMEHARPLGHH